MSVRCVLTTTFLLLGLGGGGAIDAQGKPFASRYRTLVDAHRDGQTQRAINGVLGLDSGRLNARVRRHVELANTALGTPGVDEPFFRAAAVLHTDAAIHLWGEGRSDEPWKHLDLAQQLVDASAHENEKADSFRRRSYTATTLIVASHAPPQATLEYFEDAIDTLPDEVPLLTAAGWFSERMSTRPAALPASLQRSQTLVTLEQLVERRNARDVLRHGQERRWFREEPWLYPRQFLPLLAEDTGGSVLVAERSKRLRETFVRVVNELKSRYILTYMPRGVSAGGWHAIDVRLEKDNGDVTARRGYQRGP